MIVGSLIKNPGGGLAPIGGYVAGTESCIENCAYRLTSPGLGKEVGASLGVMQSFYQGFFLAPTVVSGALKGAIFAANIYEQLGFPVIPNGSESRHDIIQAVTLGSPEGVVAFCKGIHYWNDQFLFSCDTTAPLASNREAMWQETRMNFESGAFGDPTDPETLYLFWTKMEALHYPEAGHTKQYFADKLARIRQEQQMQMAQQLQAQQQAQEAAVMEKAQRDAAAAAGLNMNPGAPAGAQGMIL